MTKARANATTSNAKGDIVVGTGSTTASALSVGTDGYMLYADSNQTQGIKWAAAPASGSMTLLSTTTLSGTATTISSISQSYTNLLCIVTGVTYSAVASGGVKVNGSGSNVTKVTASNSAVGGGSSTWIYDSNFSASQNNFELNLTLYNYAATQNHTFIAFGAMQGARAFLWGGYTEDTTAITSLVITTVAGASTFSTGTVKLYGVN